jgi:signal transduction histidine kinase
VFDGLIAMQRKSKPLKRPINLATTLAAAFAALSVISLLVAAGFQTALNVRAQQEVVAGQQRATAQAAAAEVSSVIEQVFRTLEATAQVGRPFAVTPAERQLLLNSLLELQPAFHEVALLNGRGHELVKLSRYEVLGPTDLLDLADSDLFEQVSRNQRYVGSLHIDERTREPLIAVAVPIQNIVGEFEGALTAEVSLRFMWDLMASLKIGRAGLAYVVDRQGTLIAIVDEERVLQGENVRHLSKVAEFINSQTVSDPSMTDISTGIDGAPVLVTYVPLGLPDWAVVVETPVGEAYQPIVVNVTLAAAGSLIAAIVAASIGVSLSRRLAAPVLNLTETATRIAAGHLELEAPLEGTAEVSRLAAAFNSMTAQLRELIRSLQGRVADLKKAQEEREALIAELENKNAELERFTYTVSHDLKSPLITIQGFLGYLERDALAGDREQIKHDIARIVNAAEKMRLLLDELLELSRIGRLMNPPVDVPLSELAHEAAGLVAGRIARRGVEVDIAPDLPTVHGDRIRLRELLENLIDNAVKFMGDQPHPRVEVGARREGEETVCFVRDNGIGIDPRYHDKVFGLFERLDQKVEGTGMGLAIARRIVEVHGGRIWVESEGAGRGSAFCFTLPDRRQSTQKEG